jgi:ABC-type branched-subunit amino acid transport system substrate-binding protein
VILINAIKRAIDTNGGRIPTRRQVVDAFAKAPPLKGVTGTYLFDTFGDAISPMMSVYRVDNGRWVFWQNIDARPS